MTGCKYFLTLVDDFSRTTWTYLMRQKSKTGQLVMSFMEMVRVHFGKSIKIFRTDNGGEFFSKQVVFIRVVAHTLLNKMELSKGNIVVCWKSQEV